MWHVHLLYKFKFFAFHTYNTYIFVYNNNNKPSGWGDYLYFWMYFL